MAALTGPAPKAGVVIVSVIAALVLLAREPRVRAGAMLAALVLAPVLLLADIWNSPQLGVVHRHPLPAAGAVLVGLAIVALLARTIARWPVVLAPLALVALPFRIPVEAGGTTSNLLVPLYVVVACGALAYAVPQLAGRAADSDDAATSPGWLERLLAAYVVLYALQSLYSSGFEKALQQMVFFYVPFALLFCLLRSFRWDGQSVRRCLAVVAGLAVLFALVGYVEYATKTIILNPKLVVQNDLHAYFTVNSVFFDPDIFGRFLALVMILIAAGLLYARRQRDQLTAVGLLAILWVGLVLTLSRSSLAALLVGLGTLAALRWGAWRKVLIGTGVVVLAGAAALAISPKTFGLNQGLNGASSGRAGLISGGVTMFEQRPVWGYGSGSFVNEYRRRHPGTSGTLAASHTIPVTIAAEQGVIGEVVYVALVIVAVVMLLRGARNDPARAAIAAAFLALVLHTWLYADFLEDPVTWTLLGVGAAMARRPWPIARAEAADPAEVPALAV